MQVYPRCSNEDRVGGPLVNIWMLDVAMRMGRVVLWSTHGCMYILDVAMRMGWMVLWSTHGCMYILDVAMRIGWESSGKHMDASISSM
ncbi:hypothetical protein DPMN_073302 [Dreissena polymorpha]|uniref:Uncharacterized protein n=1 Tax=Dreissena polymorpha TaxID=45954 RepID=A0A9D4BYS8_DREPO|nr:hypothetical protein DPMN_073302 [Dreissena polymorpha]